MCCVSMYACLDNLSEATDSDEALSIMLFISSRDWPQATLYPMWELVAL